MIPFNPRDSHFIANPYPTYAWLRIHDPVHRRPEQNDWIITRYDDVAALLRDPRLGHAPRQASTRLEVDPLLKQVQSGRHSSDLWLAKRNPPEHTHLRQMIKGLFSPQAVAQITPFIQQTVKTCLTQTSPSDLMRDLARPLPARVICHMMGIPPQEQEPIMAAIRYVPAAADLDPRPEQERIGWFALETVNAQLRQLVQKARTSASSPKNIISTLLAKQHPGALDTDELIAQCALLLFAGHATTESLIGNAVLALLSHPEEWAQLRHQPALIPLAVEECLRYDPPAQAASRTVLEEVSLRRQILQKGQRVMLLLGSAHRDPTHFSEPDRLDIKRHPNLHLAFGAGPHICPGAYLARTQAAIALGALVEHFPNLSLAAPPVWADGFSVRTLASLPINTG